MEREWDDRERGAAQAEYRAHLRDLHAARQAAERAQALASRRNDQEGRRAAAAALRAELARLRDEHEAWLREHVQPPDLPGEGRGPRFTPPEPPQ